MATTSTIKMRIQIRRDIWDNWELHKGEIPAAGEPCFIIDKNILKIGDGVTTFEKLEPINVQLGADGKSIVLEDGVFKLAGFDPDKVGAQPVVGKNGELEWIVPSTEIVDGLQTTVGALKDNVSILQSDVSGLKSDISDIRAIVGTTDSGSDTLLSRVESLEKEMETFVTSITPDDDTVNTLMELIEYVGTHGKETASIVSDIKILQELVGSETVSDRIIAAIEASEKKTEALYEKVKYEITNVPTGTLVDYRDKEIRVMVPANAQFAKQNVGATGNANMYYMAFKAYAPDGAVSFKEGDRGVIVDEMFDFNGDFAGVDKYGRKYSICWLALASYDATKDAWTYYGKNSSTKKYIGWDYCVEWYDANGVVISSDHIRINLSNEACHNNVEPFYMKSYVSGVKVNGTLLDIVDGVVDVTIPVHKSSDEIVVNEDGTLGIVKVGFDKIVQDPETVIVMDGGSAV